MMLFLSKSDPLVSEFPAFTLDVREVVDSLMESPKCVATRIEQEPEAPARSYRNWILQFGKSEGPILSGPIAVRGAIGFRRSTPLTKQCLDGGESQQPWRLERWLRDLIKENQKRKEN
jgi:hypothetical protein